MPNHYKEVGGLPVQIDIQQEKLAAGNGGMFLAPNGERYPFDMFRRANRTQKLTAGVWEGEGEIIGVPDGPDTVVDSEAVLTFETDHVKETRTRRALTAQEIIDRDAQSETDRLNRVEASDVFAALKQAYEAIHHLNNEVRKLKSQSVLQPQQTAAGINGLNEIDAATFRSWMGNLK